MFRLFTEPFVQAQIKGNIKAPHHWPLWGEFTGDLWIPEQRASNAETVFIWWLHHEQWSYPFHALTWYLYDIDGLMQERCNSSALALQLRLSCTNSSIRPTEPHALAWGPTNFHTKIFQLERHRLKIDEKIIDSFSNVHLPIQWTFPYLLCKFHIVPPKVHMGNPDLFVPRWRMPPGLLCFGHDDWIAIC